MELAAAVSPIWPKKKPPTAIIDTLNVVYIYIVYSHVYSRE